MLRGSSADFVRYLQAALNDQCGYILGTRGQDPRTLNEWYITGQYDGVNRSYAERWRRDAPRVYDCNGLMEGWYYHRTGVDLNRDARYDKAYKSYDNLTTERGKGVIPIAKRAPGVAVYYFYSNLVRHVGYLERERDGDWDVIEARGVRYGVVRTRLSQRPWNRWGVLGEIVDYNAQSQEGDEAMQKGVVTLSNKADTLNVRSGPSMLAAIIGELADATIVTIVKQSGKWYQVVAGELYGYCHASNVRIATGVSYRLTITGIEREPLEAIRASYGGVIEEVATT